GYRSILPHGVYPVAFLFLEIPVEEIDVNVHPAKTEIRFRRTEAVKDVIAEAVRGALASAGIVAETTVRGSEPIIDVEATSVSVAAELTVQSTMDFPTSEQIGLEPAQRSLVEPPRPVTERTDEAAVETEQISFTGDFELIAGERI